MYTRSHSPTLAYNHNRKLKQIITLWKCRSVLCCRRWKWGWFGVYVIWRNAVNSEIRRRMVVEYFPFIKFLISRQWELLGGGGGWAADESSPPTPPHSSTDDYSTPESYYLAGHNINKLYWKLFPPIHGTAAATTFLWGISNKRSYSTREWDFHKIDWHWYHHIHYHDHHCATTMFWILT